MYFNNTEKHTDTHTVYIDKKRQTDRQQPLFSHHSLLRFLAAAIIDPHGQVMDQSQPLGDLDLLLLRQLTGWSTDVG